MVSAFKDLRDYVAVPRVVALRLSPDGSRLVCVVQALNPDGTSYGTSVWGLPATPEGETPPGAGPRRLTRSAKGEGAAEFTPAGDVLFVSRRADPSAREQAGDEPPALWLLPAAGGEARRVAARPGGISGVRVGGPTIVFAADVLPGDETTEAGRRKARKEAGVSAILHEDYPVRYWDHDLGPGEPRLFAGALPEGDERPGETIEARDLTPEPGRQLHAPLFAVSPDGATVFTTRRVPIGAGESREELVAIDVRGADGTPTGPRPVASMDGYDFGGLVAVSPDGRHVACVRERHANTERPAELDLWVVDLATGRGGAHGHGLWPAALAWAPDSRSLYVAADHQGRRPIFRVPVEDGTGDDGAGPERVTPDDAAYAELNPAPDGRHIYALRSGVGGAPAPVRVTVADGTVAELPSPAPRLDLPGTLTEVTATADDGATVRAWLALPEGASPDDPAPLLLWIHGGPLASWNDWSWRWNPWLMTERGYAVLLPDPCLSTGYGQEMIRRGWANWGPRTQADLMAVTDACVARPDIDAERVAVMGGSFGGYMANWLAGHTDRFLAIVTHAALWHLDQFSRTTDASMYWRREFGSDGSPLYAALSPHTGLADITTPMLVIHGDRDYRVPIGEALRLWWDLRSSEVEAKFLYFPDENHWILKPGNIVAWYETVLAFLATHVLGEEWKRPESLS